MVRASLIIALVLVLSSRLFSQAELSPDQIFEKVNNSVVVVMAYDKSGNLYQGSGVVLNNRGYVATNYHVCSDASRIDIKHYNTEFKNAEIYLKDTILDLLILKIPDNSLSPLAINNAALKSGQRVYSIGSPEGYENSISEGIISGFRYDENRNKLIQMTTPITEGSSGGALVDSKGELIGLSVSGQHEGNLYFAIPVDYVIAMTGSENLVISEINAQVDYYQEGTLAKESENYKDAEFYYTKHLEKFSYDVKAYFNRGCTRTKLKEYRKAIADFDKAIEYNPEDAETYFYRGNCKYSLKEFEEAVLDYNTAIEIDQDYAEFYYNRGYAFYKLKLLKEAVDDWAKCIKLNPDYSAELSNKIKTTKEKLDK